MDYKAIINLMKEMNQTELTKLEVETDGVRICLEKGNNQTAVTPQIVTIPQGTVAPLPAPYAAAEGIIRATSEVALSPAAPAAQATAAIGAAAPIGTAEAAGARKLVSPMVGTFYAQASPEKPPFIKVGDQVKKGQTICIIEAMKLMNEIESEYDGEILEVLVKNEDMVEFGQPLFLLK